MVEDQDNENQFLARSSLIAEGLYDKIHLIDYYDLNPTLDVHYYETM
jgi:hypothetical protein